MFSCNFSQLIIFPPLFAPIFHLCFIKVEFETPYLYVLGPFIDDITYGNLDHVLAGLTYTLLFLPIPGPVTIVWDREQLS